MARSTGHHVWGKGIALAIAAALLVVACSGSSPPSTDTGSPVASSLPSSAPSPAPVVPSEAPSITSIDGQFVLGSLTNDVEEYFVLDDDGQRKLFEAAGCNPCLSTSADGRFIVHPYVAAGDAFAAAVYDVAAGTTDELPVPAELSGLGPGPLSPGAERFLRHGWSDADPERNALYSTLLDGSDLVTIAPITDGRGRDPLEWSPDGAALLVFSEDVTRPAARHLGDLSIIAVDDGVGRVVNPPGTSASAIIRYGTVASFSPDGSQVAFAARKTDEPKQSALFVVPVGSGEARQITSWGTGTTTALWSPAGDVILFDRDGLTGPAISLVRPDGSDLRDVWASSAGSFGCCGTWSPSGAQILFQRGSGEMRHLWVMDADGHVQGRVEAEPASWIWYRWTPKPPSGG